MNSKVARYGWLINKKQMTHLAHGSGFFGTEGPMPMADTAKGGAKAPKRNGGKKAAKKAVEAAPTGETVNTKPQPVETKPDPEPSTGEAVQTQPQVAETKPSPQPPTDSKNVYQPKEARTLMVFGCTPKVTKDAVRARWPSAEKFFFLYKPFLDPHPHPNPHPRTALTLTPKNLSVIFKTAAEAEAEAKAGMVEIAGEKLRVAMRETPEQKAARMEIFQKKVLLASLPSGVTEADVLQAFPGAEGVILHQNKQKGEANGWATVTLQTGEAAVAAVGVEVVVKGVKVTPFAHRLNLPAVEASKKRKAPEPSPTVADPSAGTAEPGEASMPPKKKLKKAAAH